MSPSNVKRLLASPHSIRKALGGQLASEGKETSPFGHCLRTATQIEVRDRRACRPRRLVTFFLASYRLVIISPMERTHGQPNYPSEDTGMMVLEELTAAGASNSISEPGQRSRVVADACWSRPSVLLGRHRNGLASSPAIGQLPCMSNGKLHRHCMGRIRSRNAQAVLGPPATFSSHASHCRART